MVYIRERATPGRWTCSPDPVSHSRPRSVPLGTLGIPSESGSIPFVASQSRQILSGPAEKTRVISRHSKQEIYPLNKHKKQSSPPLHTSMEVMSYHANNDNRHIKFVIHYTALNVYAWFCVNCIQ